MSNLVIYIHGKGGNAGEGEYYKKFFSDAEIYGFDYKSNTPWEAKSEFFEEVSELAKQYNSITLIAESIEAYFSLASGMEGGEHWFHTDEQMKFLDEWLQNLW